MGGIYQKKISGTTDSNEDSLRFLHIRSDCSANCKAPVIICHAAVKSISAVGQIARYRIAGLDLTRESDREGKKISASDAPVKSHLREVIFC